MKKLIALLMIVSACCLFSGCMFVPTSQSTVHRWQNSVKKWVPVGTPGEEACRIMTLHGFDIVTKSADSINCQKDTGFNYIVVGFTLVDNKVSAPPLTYIWRSGNL